MDSVLESLDYLSYVQKDIDLLAEQSLNLVIAECLDVDGTLAALFDSL